MFQVNFKEAIQELITTNEACMEVNEHMLVRVPVYQGNQDEKGELPKGYPKEAHHFYVIDPKQHLGEGRNGTVKVAYHVDEKTGNVIEKKPVAVKLMRQTP